MKGISKAFSKSGSRKTLFVLAGYPSLSLIVMGGLIQFVAFVQQVVFYGNLGYKVTDVFSESMMYGLLGAAGLSGTIYGAARTLKGSEEYDKSGSPPDPAQNLAPDTGEPKDQKIVDR